MRFIARHRRVIMGIVAVLGIAGFVYLIIKTNNMKEIDVNSQIYAGKAFGTAVKKTIYAEKVEDSNAADAAIDKCLVDIENQISARVVDSEVSGCNRNYSAGGVYEFSDNIIGYLKQEMQIYKESKGAFSPCIRPLTALWGIEEGLEQIPDKNAIQGAVEASNGENMKVTDKGIIFSENNMSFDFGASGKGIACDEVEKQLKKTDIQGAVISIGGSILVYGDKGDGKEWHIGIQDPRAEEGDVLGIVDVDGGLVISTSGDYEKYFELDGKRYHHIMNPKTGYPADSGLISVTIISEDGLESDAMSTACFVMGLKDGMNYANKKKVQAVFVTTEKEVYVTDALKDKFRMKAEDYKLIQ